MKILSVLLLLFFIYIPSCYSLNLDSRNLYENVLKSLDEEPENWIIRSNELFYIGEGKVNEVRKSLYPEISDYCLVEISFTLLKDDPLIYFKKPINKFLENGKLNDRFAKKIAEILSKELIKTYNLKSTTENFQKENPISQKPKEKSKYSLDPL